MEIENEKNNGLVFARGCNYGAIKSISFNKTGPFTLTLSYDKPLEGINQVLASYELAPPTNVENEFK